MGEGKRFVEAEDQETGEHVAYLPPGEVRISLPNPRAQSPPRRQLAQPLRLAGAVHAPRLQRPSGTSLQGDPDGYPSKNEIADYLERYAGHFELPVLMETGVRSLTRINGGFRARTEAGEIIDARAVVLATGAFQQPAIPAISRRLSPSVMQLTPESYKRPGQIPSGRVLIVGDGATGRQIAVELADKHEVLLAMGRPRRVSPQRILGRSVFWWMDRLGILRASRETRVGRYLMGADPFPGRDLKLRRLQRWGVRAVGRLLDVDGKDVAFASGETAEVDAVVWATGYKDDSRWAAIPEVKDGHGGFIHWRGVSPVRVCISWVGVGSGRAGRPCSSASAMTLPTWRAGSPSARPGRRRGRMKW